MSKIIDLGKVMATPAGEWRVDASYEFLSIVSHNGNGYISKVDCIGIEPGANDAVWMLLVSAGHTPDITRDAKGNIYVDGELLTSAFADAEAAASQIVETNTAVRAAEQARVNAENARVNAEQQRASAETSRQQAETNRKNSESARVNAETNRSNQENARRFNETNRMNAETQRVGAENTRMSNESSRILQFNEIMRRSEEAIEEAQAAARTVGGKGIGEYKVVIGRAIPASKWVPGVDYFCSDGKFKFRVKASAIDQNEFNVTFKNPIPAPIAQFLMSNVNKAGTLIGEASVEPDLGDVFFTDSRGNATGMHIERIQSIVGEYDTSADLVFTAPTLNYNVLSYNGVSVNGKEIETAKGTSQFLQVVKGHVSCVKPLPVYWDYTSGLYRGIPEEVYGAQKKNRAVVAELKRKRRKRTRNGDTVNTRKVKWMRDYREGNGRHARHFRIYAICRHWKSVYFTEVNYKRRYVSAPSEP